MSKVTAVIFDIDGTLLLSNEAHARAYVEAAAMLGIKADFTKLARVATSLFRKRSVSTRIVNWAKH